MLTMSGFILFLIIGSCVTLFFVMNGSDFGAGMATVFVKDDRRRSEILRVPSPVWFGNETWLVVGMGIMFATFPRWYAGLTSGYFLVFIATLVCLILRGAAFEFRLKWKHVAPNAFWNAALIVGSLGPPLLLGMVFASTLEGVPIVMEVVRPDVFNPYAVVSPGFFDIVTPFSVWTGVVLVLFSLALGLARVMKYDSADLGLERTLRKKLRLTLWLLLGAVAVEATLFNISIRPFLGAPHAIVIIGLVLLGVAASSLYLLSKGKYYLVYWVMVVMIASIFILIFWELFPNAINGSGYLSLASLTLADAASGAVSQRTVLIGVAILMPLMITGQVAAYRFQSKRFAVADTDINT
ncbi:MAG: cytochrome d ubiquinol oxidase subunit II [Defluviitaleaceae bacterium]|nr:cytochrome d ubiquinol oxidase subunit II [Defluviitaleaceae bacterium]